MEHKFNLPSMFSATKKSLGLKPWYITLYVVVLVILTVSSFIEYQSRYRDLLQLIQDQAAMTAAVIAQSGSGQAYLTEEIKQSYIDHAIDVLSILNKVDAEKDLGTNRLDELVNEGNILKVIIFNEQGQVEHAVVKDPVRMKANALNEGEWAQRHLQPIFDGEQDLVIVGVDQEIQEDVSGINRGLDQEARFLVAIARDRGGALACHLSVSDDDEFKYLTAVETALEDLLQVKDLQYLKLTIDDQEPYYVSKLGSVVDESWSREPLEDILYQVSKGDTSLLEVVRPVFFNSSFGEVRIGFNADTLLSLRGQIIIQILIRSTLLTILAFVTLIFLMTRQNAALLKKEKKRIEAEVFQLEKLNRLREKQVAMGELAAGVAHEIRNPLNAIGIVAQRLKREFVPQTDLDEYHTLTGTMVSEIDRINNTLQEFLEYTGPMPLILVRIEVNKILNQVMELYRSQAQANQVDLILDETDLVLEGDGEFLQQALSNIVKNAIEACQAGDRVTLSAHKNRSTIEITIQDTGVGIDQAEQSRIFDLYYTTKDMGTGVGLALTHKIIADHFGAIEVESDPGRGSKFIINLPVKQ
ncbi:MAG: ATP-binding protein [Candidatus Marinimicrobia bacterium]|nr:ATP-binding protein [Candidatus Neomarinimicrobiota bacterium]